LRAVARRIRHVTILASIVGICLWQAPTAAAETPIITSVSVGGVAATSVILHGTVDPNGSAQTFFRFEYLPEAVYLASREAHPEDEEAWFTGASWAPSSGHGLVGTGSTPITLNGQEVRGLTPNTAYSYRLRVENSSGGVPSVVCSTPRPFGTQPPTNAFDLLDRRGWEMVSPVDKAGGAIQPPGTVSGGGVFQASAHGGSFTFSSADSFGVGAQGAPSGSQYVATRGVGGWTTANITTPLLSGSYGSEPDGVPYQVFSEELAFGLLSNGERCRGQVGAECPVANPPLPGSGAPAGYRDYYLRTASGSYESLLTAGDLANTALAASQVELHLVAATPELTHVAISSCAALTADATEVPAPGGCNSADQNLYEWTDGALSLINLLPGEPTGTPGARIAASSGAISSNGSRVYFILGGNVYLREGDITKTVLGTQGGEFETASANGEVAYLIVGGQLIRYSAVEESLTPLTSGTGVNGVLGASAEGSTVYYAQSGAVFLYSGGAPTEVASSADPEDWPAATGTARVTADGSHLLFLSDAELTGYPNEGNAEVFLYGPPPAGGDALLTCVSCNPSGEGAQGSASIPGARPNGNRLGATDFYKPRDLSADGNRVFFETPDALVAQDTNRESPAKGIADVYEWEVDGEGTCGRSGGCVQLISSGRDQEPSYFLDADEDGSEAFFLTAASLYPLDPGSYDVYDAREDGGFPVPESPIPCVADACQVLPEAPEDPTPGTLVPNSGNPALKVSGAGGGGKVKRKHKRKKHQRKYHNVRSRGHGKQKGR
jgi:hypothetical protein